jgi:hypothetical protein
MQDSCRRFPIAYKLPWQGQGVQPRGRPTEPPVRSVVLAARQEGDIISRSFSMKNFYLN